MIIRPCCVCGRHNATLQKLWLASNLIGDVGVAAIVEGLRCVHTRVRLMIVGVTCSGEGV